MDGIQNKKKCYNFLKYDVYEPIKVTLLYIFYDNMHIIERILKTKKEEIKTPCRKFVCECLKIYKQMDGTYCHKRYEQGQKQNYTCLKLDIFSKAYKFFHDKLLGIDPKIPSLDNIDSVCSDTCLPNESESQLHSHKAEDQVSASRMRMTSAGTDPDDTLEEVLPEVLEKSNSSMKKHITTTIGTVAGASSILALLYKFSLARRWVDSGIGGSRRRISNNLYTDATNELMFQGLEHGNFNSYNIEYEAA